MNDKPDKTEKKKRVASPKVIDPEAALVPAAVIGRKISVTGRYILQLAEQNRIPCNRIGPKCVRFNPAAVAAALGFEWDGGKA